jgi:hypothetical protein
LPRLVEHFITGNLIPGNIKVLISDFVFVQQLLDFKAPGSGSCGIYFYLFCHFILLESFIFDRRRTICPPPVLVKLKAAGHNYPTALLERLFPKATWPILSRAHLPRPIAKSELNVRFYHKYRQVQPHCQDEGVYPRNTQRTPFLSFSIPQRVS